MDGLCRGGPVWRSRTRRAARRDRPVRARETEGGMLDLGGFYGLHPALRQPARDVPRPANCWRCTRWPDPIGCAAISRRRTIWNAAPTGVSQRLAEPCGRASGGQRAGAGEGTRWRSGLRSRCCCAGRRGSEAGHRTGFGPAGAGSLRRVAALAAADPVIGPAFARACAHGVSADAVLAGVPACRRSARRSRRWDRSPAKCWRVRRSALRRVGDRRLGHAWCAGASV